MDGSMTDPPSVDAKENKFLKVTFAVVGIMSTLVIYGVLQGNLLMAIDFVSCHKDCFFDIALLSTVATASQFFISYTIRTFGALTFATIMTTRQLVSILLSCVWFAHPLSVEQCIGAVIVFGSLYVKAFLKSKPEKPLPSSHKLHDEEVIPLKAIT